MGLKLKLECDGKDCPSFAVTEHQADPSQWPADWRRHRGKVICSDGCAEVLDPLSLEAVLDKAFGLGAECGEGYRNGLTSMHSRRTVGEGDLHDTAVRKRWLDEVRPDLLARARPAGYKALAKHAQLVLSDSASKRGVGCDLARMVLNIGKSAS